MPTELQKQVMRLRADKIKAHKPIVMSELILEAGGSIHTARKPYQITRSKGWNELLAEYDDEPVMKAVYRDALNDKDSRNATANRVLYFKLKDRFPANKMKISQYDSELEQV